MNKKSFLVFISTVAISFLVLTSYGMTQSEFEGVTLRFLCQGGTAYKPALKDFAKEFEKTTGAKVLFEFAPWETLMPKVMTDVTSGAGRFDLFCSDIEFQYSLEPYLLPLDEYIKKTNYDMEGFFKPVYEYGVWSPKGVRYGLPIEPNVAAVFYRTDLLKKSGYSEFPTTWESYHKFLAANTNPDKGMYGVSRAGVIAQLPRLFLAHYTSKGKPLLTSNWEPLINGEEGVWSLETLKKEAEKFQAPGWLSWDNPDAANAFAAGNAAVTEVWPTYTIRRLENPQKSKVIGKWNIAPGYPEGGTPNFVQHNIVIFKATDHPEAAFKFLAYITGPANAKRLLIDYGVTCGRKNFWTHPGVLAKRPYLKNFAKALDRAKPFLPGVPQWLEMFLALGKQISGYLAGDIPTAQAALDTVAKKWKESIAANPLSFKYKE